MVKKLFALASVTALTGIVSAGSSVGCSDSTENVGGDAATDAKRETGGPKVEPGDEEPGDPLSCMVSQKLDATKEPYQPPNLKPGVCTTDQLKALGDFLDAQVEKAEKGDKDALDFTNGEWAAAAKLTAECAACVFTNEDAPKWGAILSDKADDKFVGYNWGGCMNVVTGSDACGKGFQQLYLCRLAACNECKTDAEAQECYADGAALFGKGGPCEDAFAAAETACGGDAAFQTAQKQCSADKTFDYTFQRIANLFCIKGGLGPDGGSDSGTDSGLDAAKDGDATK